MLTFDAVDETLICTMLHFLAPDPVDKVKSNTSESHEPIVWGLNNITVGSVGREGGRIATVVVDVYGHAEQF
jgi:hypothetical protein